MGAELLVEIGMALAGPGMDWKVKVSEFIGVKPDVIEGWILADEVEQWAADMLSAHYAVSLGAYDYVPEKWLYANSPDEDDRMRYWISHQHEPRFSARVVRCDDEGVPLSSEAAADIERGLNYRGYDDTLLCEIRWEDPVDAADQAAVLKAAHAKVLEIREADRPSH
jgi:hypothetical protein